MYYIFHGQIYTRVSRRLKAYKIKDYDKSLQFLISTKQALVYKNTDMILTQK